MLTQSNALKVRRHLTTAISAIIEAQEVENGDFDPLANDLQDVRIAVGQLRRRLRQHYLEPGDRVSVVDYDSDLLPCHVTGTVLVVGHNTAYVEFTWLNEINESDGLARLEIAYDDLIVEDN